MCFEGLFDLLKVLEQAQVGSKLTGRLCDTGQRSEYLSVDLTGVSLTGNRNNTSKAKSSAIICSIFLIFSSSPSNSSIKEACVPVVPLEPSMRRFSIR